MVLTTGTFLRGVMHTGSAKTESGRAPSKYLSTADSSRSQRMGGAASCTPTTRPSSTKRSSTRATNTSTPETSPIKRCVSKA
ncbi:MAG: hypothetical protein AAGK24_01400 [Planctomycetota bacterium]